MMNLPPQSSGDEAMIADIASPPPLTREPLKACIAAISGLSKAAAWFARETGTLPSGSSGS